MRVRGLPVAEGDTVNCNQLNMHVNRPLLLILNPRFSAKSTARAVFTLASCLVVSAHAAVDKPASPGGKIQRGIAATYPRDLGLEKDPSVVFAENIEGTDFRRWNNAEPPRRWPPGAS
jgi:hypothetical protein